jgi:hypothetical protein
MKTLPAKFVLKNIKQVLTFSAGQNVEFDHLRMSGRRVSRPHFQIVNLVCLNRHRFLPNKAPAQIDITHLHSYCVA